jgi:hypothetical protein
VKAAVVYHKPVPNFEKIYSDFQAKMEKTKNSRMLTVVEPFTFDSEVQRVNVSTTFISNPKSSNYSNKNYFWRKLRNSLGIKFL